MTRDETRWDEMRKLLRPGLRIKRWLLLLLAGLESRRSVPLPHFRARSSIAAPSDLAEL